MGVRTEGLLQSPCSSGWFNGIRIGRDFRPLTAKREAASLGIKTDLSQAIPSAVAIHPGQERQSRIR